MEYFHVLEDNRVKGPKLSFTRKELEAEAVAKQMVLKEQVELSDFLCIRQAEGTYYLISAKVQEVLGKIDESIGFIPVQLVDMERNRMDLYFRIRMEAKENCIMNGIGNSFEKQEDMILLEGQTKPVLMVKERNRSYLLVSIPVAEMFLRRQVIGMQLQRVKQQRG